MVFLLIVSTYDYYGLHETLRQKANKTKQNKTKNITKQNKRKSKKTTIN